MKSEFEVKEEGEAEEKLEAIAVLEQIRDTLGKVLSNPPKIQLAAPIINLPSQAAPTVQVEAPVVKLQAPPYVKHGWRFEVTSRDQNGLIKTFTATPVEPDANLR